MGNNALLEAALSYAAQGFKVFPLKPSEKTPITPHGLKDASQLQSTIKKYWGKWPNSNIGLVCDGLLVLDFDGKAGAESKTRLIAKYGELPRTWAIKTGGGTQAEPKEQGEHYVYRVPTDLNIRPGAGKYGYPKLDIRANDSYIVATPSVTRLTYETIDSSPVAAAPSWLIELAKQPQGSNERKPTSNPPRTQIFEGDGRNAACATEAGRLAKIYKDEEIVRQMARAYDQAVCVPPLGEELDRTVFKSVPKWVADAIEHQRPAENPKAKALTIPAPTVRTLASIAATEVSWLWWPYIPFGKLTLLEGDPGAGKSWASLAVATAISIGRGLPNQAETAEGQTLLASAEDGLSDTIKPRLVAMTANTERIHAIDGLFTLDDGGFTMLESWIAELMPILVIIDPLVAYLSGELDIHRANQVRHATARLHRLAEQYGPAIIAIRHLTKGGSSKAIYRGQGSIDFTASARSVLMAGYNEDTGERGFCQIKNNLAAKGEPVGFDLKDGNFTWKAETTLTIDQILGPEEPVTPRNEAEDFLHEVLADGPLSAKEIFKLADERSIAEATLKRAKKHGGIVSYNENRSGKEGAGAWYWKLPGGDHVTE